MCQTFIIRLFLLFGLVTSINLTAQDTRLILSGFVKDEDTGEALPFSAIFSEGGATYADELGYYQFVFTPSGPEDSLLVQFVGYKKRFFAPTDLKTGSFDILLKVQANLPTIEVRAPGIQAPGGSIIAADLLQLKRQPLLAGEEDYLKALTILPGITSGVEGTANLQIRGGSPDQTQLIVDGSPLYYANHIGGFLSALPPYMIKKMTVYKGGVPGQFGGRLSGVVDVLFQEGSRKPRTGEISIGTATMRAGVEQAVGKKGSMQASGRFAYPSLVVDALSLGDFERGVSGDKVNFRIYDFVGKYAKPVNKRGHFSVTAFGSGDNGILQETFGPEVILDQFNWQNYFVSARYFQGLGKGWTLSINPYFSDFAYNYKTLVNENLATGESRQVERSGMKSSVQDIGVRAQLQWQITNDQRLTFDAFSVRHDFTATAGKTPRFEEEFNTLLSSTEAGWEQASSLAYEFSVWQGTFNGYAALRSSRFVGRAYQTDFLLEPRLRLQYQLTPLLSINAGYDGHVQYLHQIQVEGSLLPSEIWVLNTEDAPAAQSQQVYFGLSGRSEGWEWYVEAYQKQMQNLIRLAFAQSASFTFDQDWTEAIYSDGDGRASGLECYLVRNTPRWQASLAYTLSQSDRRFLQVNNREWFPFTYDRRHVITTTATFEPNEKWSFSGSVVYQSGHAITLPTARGLEFLVFDKFNSGRMPDFFRVDIGISRHWQSRRHLSNTKSLRFSVYNLTNRANPHQLLIRPQEEQTTNPVTGEIITSKEWRVFQLSLFPILPALSYQVEFGGMVR